MTLAPMVPLLALALLSAVSLVGDSPVPRFESSTNANAVRLTGVIADEAALDVWANGRPNGWRTSAREQVRMVDAPHWDYEHAALRPGAWLYRHAAGGAGEDATALLLEGDTVLLRCQIRAEQAAELLLQIVVQDPVHGGHVSEKRVRASSEWSTHRLETLVSLERAQQVTVRFATPHSNTTDLEVRRPRAVVLPAIPHRTRYDGSM